MHRWDDCCLDEPGEVDDELNEKYVSSFKPDRNPETKEMHFISG